MNDINIPTTIIIQILTLVSLLLLLFMFIKIYKSVKLKKRITKFSLSVNNEVSTPFFDRIYRRSWQFIHFLSKIFNTIPLLRFYGKSFDKYISYYETDYKSGIDYVSIKISLAFLFSGLNLAIKYFEHRTFDIIGTIIFFVIGFFIIDISLRFKYVNRKKKIKNELLNAVITINNSFKNGRNINQAIEIIANELTGPIADEFKKISLDISYGLSIQEAFNRFYNRISLSDVKYITSSLIIAEKTGSNITKVFSSIERNFIARKKIYNEVSAIIAPSKLIYKILIILPLLLIGILIALDPNYFEPLYKTANGILIIFTTTLLYMFYIITIKIIMRVDVL